MNNGTLSFQFGANEPGGGFRVTCSLREDASAPFLYDVHFAMSNLNNPHYEPTARDVYAGDEVRNPRYQGAANELLHKALILSEPITEAITKQGNEQVIIRPVITADTKEVHFHMNDKVTAERLFSGWKSLVESPETQNIVNNRLIKDRALPIPGEDFPSMLDLHSNIERGRQRVIKRVADEIRGDDKGFQR